MAKASKEVEEGKIFAFLAYLLSIIGFLIVLLATQSPSCAFSARDLFLPTLF